MLALAGCAGDLPGSPASSAPAAVLTPVPGGATPGTSESAPPSASGAPSASDSTSSSPAPGGSDAPDAVAIVACDGTDVAFASAVLGSTVELLPDTPPGRGLQSYVDSGAGAELGLPRDGWRLASIKLPRATFIVPSAESWAFATLVEQADGSWQFDEGGTCDLVAKAPAALAFASWEVDASSPPMADATRFVMAAREQACANGRPPAERALPPIIDETATAVTITLLVRRLENADCQGNPSYPVEIALSRPLGERSLLDGSVYPPAQRN